MTAWRETIANGRGKLNSQHHIWLGKSCLLVPPELAAPSPLLPCGAAASPYTAAPSCHHPPGPSISWGCTCESLPKTPWCWPQNLKCESRRSRGSSEGQQKTQRGFLTSPAGKRALCLGIPAGTACSAEQCYGRKNTHQRGCVMSPPHPSSEPCCSCLSPQGL